MDQQVIQSPHVRAAARFWARSERIKNYSQYSCCRVSAAIESVDSRSEAPLDDEIKKCMMDPRINVFLAPLPKSEHRAATDPPIKNKFEKKALQPKLDSNKVSPQSPAELQCLHLKTKDNKPLCWHRNLQKGCSNQVKKGRCKFGYHFCMTCLKPGHGAFECKN
jgi:hypothetical protein